LNQHLAHKHDIGLEWHHCLEENCDYKSKRKGDLNEHLTNKHNINVKWHYCPEDNCDYKCKQKKSLKIHLSHSHDIGVKWYHCPENNCDYKSKNKSDLRKHQETCMGNGVGSNGEKNIKKCLSNLGFLLDIDYVYDQTFQPLSQYANKNLRPDFRFLNHNIIIEYDGIQHFKPKTFGGISKERAEENFKETQENDKLKDDFCKENNFKMIRIPYTEFENTLSILSTELFDIVNWFG